MDRCALQPFPGHAVTRLWTKWHQRRGLEPSSDQLCYAEDVHSQVHTQDDTLISSQLLTQTNNTQNQAQTGKARRERTAYIDQGGAKTTSPGESQVRHR